MNLRTKIFNFLLRKAFRVPEHQKAPKALRVLYTFLFPIASYRSYDFSKDAFVIQGFVFDRTLIERITDQEITIYTKHLKIETKITKEIYTGTQYSIIESNPTVTQNSGRPRGLLEFADDFDSVIEEYLLINHVTGYWHGETDLVLHGKDNSGFLRLRYTKRSSCMEKAIEILQSYGIPWQD